MFNTEDEFCAGCRKKIWKWPLCFTTGARETI